MFGLTNRAEAERRANLLRIQHDAAVIQIEGLRKQIEGLKADVRHAEEAFEAADENRRRLAHAITGGDKYIDAMAEAEALRRKASIRDDVQKDLRDELEAYKVAEREANEIAAAEAQMQAHREKAEADEAERQANPYLSDRPRTVQLRRVDSSMILLTRKGVTEIERAPNGNDLDVRITGAFGMDRFTVTRDLRLSVEWDDEQAEGA